METSPVTGASPFNPFSPTVALGLPQNREPLKYYIVRYNMTKARYTFSHWEEGRAVYIFEKVLPK